MRENLICVFIQPFFVAEGHTIITLPYRFGFLTKYYMTYLNKLVATETQLEVKLLLPTEVVRHQADNGCFPFKYSMQIVKYLDPIF